MTIRVRFAPSPTGYLHVGGARTALFNWLFARHHKGVFILRIEDTDEVRSTDEAVEQILLSMRWLGLDWDEGPFLAGSEKSDDAVPTLRSGPHRPSELEVRSKPPHQNLWCGGKILEKGKYGPYFQMQRLALYQKYTRELVNKGLAYHCYCLPEELEQRRQEILKKKLPPKYDGRCRHLSEKQKKEFETQGRKAVIRFKMLTTGKTKINDLVKGGVEFDNSLLDDFVLLKSTGIPTYNFAVVVDDYLMEITHVIRGDDHISNTPRQILLYQALGWKLPEFAHIPMILGPDGARLSKRHGATSLDQYMAEGYLPEALVNYLALLGWSTEDSQQIFTLPELIEKFSLERCAKNAGIFDPEKLKWMNGEYIRSKSLDAVVKEAVPFLEQEKLIDKNTDYQYIKKVIALEQERMRTFGELADLVSFFFSDKIEIKEKEALKTIKKENVVKILKTVVEKLSDLTDFSSSTLEKTIRDICVELGVKTGEVFHPLRVAVSGRTTGPGLFEMMSVLEKKRVLDRINQTIKSLEEKNYTV